MAGIKTMPSKVLSSGYYAPSERAKAVIEAAVTLQRMGVVSFDGYAVMYIGGRIRVTQVNDARVDGNFTDELAWALDSVGLKEVPHYARQP